MCTKVRLYQRLGKLISSKFPGEIWCFFVFSGQETILLVLVDFFSTFLCVICCDSGEESPSTWTWSVGVSRRGVTAVRSYDSS